MIRVAKWQWAAIAVLVGIVVLFLVIGLRPVDRTIAVSHSLEFKVPETFARVRAVLVRKDATKAILEHRGMRLLNVQLRSAQLDTSQDDRPLINALLGQSQSELNAEKLVTVEVTDSHAGTAELQLLQIAEAGPEKLDVVTQATHPQGNIQRYETHLLATPTGTQTSMSLDLVMEIRIRVPWLFTWRAQSEADWSAEQQLQEQRVSLTQLIAESADEAIVLPEGIR